MLSVLQVAWIKSDSKAILAIQTHMVAHNPRLSVTHNGHNTWKLHVSNVQINDCGTYMCQINTDPMRSQVHAMHPPCQVLSSDLATFKTITFHYKRFRTVKLLFPAQFRTNAIFKFHQCYTHFLSLNR